MVPLVLQAVPGCTIAPERLLENNVNMHSVEYESKCVCKIDVAYLDLYNYALHYLCACSRQISEYYCDEVHTILPPSFHP